MAEHSTIEWTDATWNPITGCSITSPGCRICYAMKLAGTRLKHHPSRVGLTKEVNGHHVWTGEVRFNEGWLTDPIKWKRPRRVFVCAHGDLFHESVPYEWIDRVFAVMALAPQHTFQVLTKRSARMRDYVSNAQPRVVTMSAGGSPNVSVHTAKSYHSRTHVGGEQPWPLPNVWLGVSAERQHEADARIPDLLRTPAAIRFVSLEPLLGPIDLAGIPFPDGDPRHRHDALTGQALMYGEGRNGHPDTTIRIEKPITPGLDWVIVGGESGDGAMPMHPDWVRSLRDQCAAAGVPFFYKQWGEWAPERDIAVRDQDQLMSCRYGEFHGGKDWIDSCCCAEGDDGAALYRVGKKAAGRLLDGVEHNGMPEAAR